MNDRKIRIVELPGMRVASFLGFGTEPEAQAWSKLTAWAEPRGLHERGEAGRIFGFNNPDPAPGSPNYGYELWITVDASMESTDDAKVTEFSGGLYAVCRCEVHADAYEIIPATWRQLIQWCEENSYAMADHQWLEEHISMEGLAEGNFVLDLYLPIAG